jgi:hypothetical protein
MKPSAIDCEAASGPKRRRTADQNRRSPHLTPQSRPRERQGSGQCSSADSKDIDARTIRRLRVCTGVLSALMLASVAHAVTDGLTTGLALALTLTALLLLASLGLWRAASRQQPGDIAPPGDEP